MLKKFPENYIFDYSRKLGKQLIIAIRNSENRVQTLIRNRTWRFITLLSYPLCSAAEIFDQPLKKAMKSLEPCSSA